ncbi:hypothetical protein M8J77_026412 [Diaphorina citri]|nr:hypothetical protein M8J77_026412 [Diaphorina citri]
MDFLDSKIPPYTIQVEEDIKPINSAPYKLGIKERDILDSILDELLQAGIIEESFSEFASPIFLVPKKDGVDKNSPSSFRPVVDFRKINQYIKKDNWVIPRLDLILDTMSENKIWSIMDINSAFLNHPIDVESRKYTAFKCHRGLFQFKFLPFGLSTSPEAFSREITRIFNFLLWKHIVIYIDDIICFSKDFETHLWIIEEVFKKLQEFNLRIKSSKCKFLYEEIKILGHVVSAKGTRPNPENIEAIQAVGLPKTQKEVRGFLGMCGYFRRYIKDYSKIASPLIDLTKKEYEKKRLTLNDKQITSFNTLKNKLIHPPILEYFQQNRKTVVVADSCSESLAGVLMQLDEDNNKHIIGYVSRKLTEVEKRWSATELELLGIVFVVNYFKHYLRFLEHFELHTDHKPLVHIVNTTKDSMHRLQRLLCKLVDFNFEIKHVKGKSIPLVDFLSRNATNITYEKNLVEMNQSFSVHHEKELAEMNKNFTILVENLHKAQLEDIYLRKIYDGLLDPESTETRIFRQLRKYELDEDNIIHYKSYVNNQKILVLAVPKKLIPKILKTYHDHEYNAAHLGINKCYENIRKRYYWDNMLGDITNYIKSCVSCAQRKIPRVKKAGPLQPIPMAPTNLKPMSDLCIDFLGPLPPSEGKKYVLVCTDMLTRYVITKACSEATAKTTMEFLKDVVSTYGVPSVIRSDRGTHFLNEVVKNLTKALNITHLFSTSYSPRTQGRTERFNNTLADCLSHYVNETGRNWVKYLKPCVFAYNCSIHESLQYSPFYLLHGFEPTKVDELQILSKNTSHDLAEALEILHKVRKDMPLKLEKAQEKQKKYYDQSRKQVEYLPNDLVMVYYPQLNSQTCAKFGKHFRGPYRIVRQVTPVLYEVRVEKFGKLVNEKFHVDKLKKYSPRKEHLGVVTGQQVRNYSNILPHQEPANKIDDILINNNNNDNNHNNTDENLLSFPQVEETYVETQIPESSTQSISTENTEIGIAGSSHVGTIKNIPNEEKKKKSLYNPQLFQDYLTNNPEVKEQYQENLETMSLFNKDVSS